ncbi:MAG: hypothetical protein KAS63_08130 [Candidatus Heimdallarchaeota archaeon]|nr:hypothetical protein [Candidatus Heimdallarchaeota archaeon]MCK4955318.1 hypothetical protein [Candidatus Heimdallarchaeota archaeon]
MLLVITGSIASGKTTLLEKLIEILKEKYKVGGVITIGREEKFFLNVKTKKQSVFSESKEKDGETTGKYFISKRALQFAKDAIISSLDSEIIFLDEIGRLEYNKKGIYEPTFNLLRKIEDLKQKIIIVAVREGIQSEIYNLFKIKPDRVWKITQYPQADLWEEIIHHIEMNFKKNEGGRAVS